MLAIIIVVIAAALALGLAGLPACYICHLQGHAYVLFVVIPLIGITAAVTVAVLQHRNKKQKEFEGDVADSGARTDLEFLLNDANRKLRESQVDK